MAFVIRPGVVAKKQETTQAVNPFYSPAIVDDGDNEYPFADFKVSMRTGSIALRVTTLSH
jgi:hypothetical protein